MSKNNKKILFISPFFYPEPISTGKYNTALVNALLDDGSNTIEVITSYPLYPEWKPQFTDKGIEGVSIYRGGRFVKYPQNPFLRRIILEIWFTLFVIYIYFKRKENIDLIVNVFPPSLFFAILSFFVPNTIKTFGIVHDLQSVYSEKTNGIFKNILTKIINLVETRSFSKCNYLIFLSKSMASKAKATYSLKNSKILVKYPFVNFIKQGLNDENNLANLRKLFSQECKHVVYSGALGDKQNPSGLLHFFQSLVNSIDGVNCHIFSRGPLFDVLLKSLDVDFKEKILFHDLVPETCLQELYSLSDFHIVPQALGTSEGSLPSKLPNLLTCGVPIFAISDEDSELSQIISESRIGCSINTWNSDILVSRFIDFMSIVDGKSKTELQFTTKDYVESNFTISSLVEVILESENWESRPCSVKE